MAPPKLGDSRSGLLLLINSVARTGRSALARFYHLPIFTANLMPFDHLHATVSALKNGLTSLPLGSAMDNTETWQQQFLQSGQPGLQDIAREIGNLQSLLSNGALSARAIGNSLSMLGDQTSEASAQASADLKKPLLELADLLRRHGGDLLAHADKSQK